VVVTYAIPRIIYISNQKKLFDVPNERSAARVITPTLGGAGIFAGFFISLAIAINNFNHENLSCLLLASMVMFMVGLKDDLIGLSARRKLFFQLLIAGYLIFMCGVRITRLHGVLGIDELDPLSSSTLTMLAFVGIVNAYNLIDGIDGLASGIGILISIAFGSLFIRAGHLEYAMVAFSLTGSLTAFFFFNVFGRVNKIFMGDTGSLTLGVIFAFLTIKYVGLPDGPRHIIGSPAIVMAIMIVPIIDTLRVMSIRISQRRSPFSPDMNHIHHQLLRLNGGNHLHSSLIIIVANLTFIIFAVSFAELMSRNEMFFIILGAGFVTAYIPVLANKHKAENLRLRRKEEPLKVIRLNSEIQQEEESKVAEG
jgi:UDP-N-acetylmuramyl pentapeptide phosphotransferase/UDP-N-acetylglucosamine-1-phosphate transferase